MDYHLSNPTSFSGNGVVNIMPYAQHVCADLQKHPLLSRIKNSYVKKCAAQIKSNLGCKPSRIRYLDIAALKEAGDVNHLFCSLPTEFIVGQQCAIVFPSGPHVNDTGHWEVPKKKATSCFVIGALLECVEERVTEEWLAKRWKTPVVKGKAIVCAKLYVIKEIVILAVAGEPESFVSQAANVPPTLYECCAALSNDSMPHQGW
jgi:hypothetical protein